MIYIYMSITIMVGSDMNIDSNSLVTVHLVIRSAESLKKHGDSNVSKKDAGSGCCSIM